MVSVSEYGATGARVRCLTCESWGRKHCGDHGDHADHPTAPEKDWHGWTHEEAKRHTLVERLHERCALYGGSTCPDRLDLAHDDWCERCLAAEVLLRALFEDGTQ